MRVLADRINLELAQHPQCGVYEDELAARWPLDAEDREKKIADFAKHNGFHLRFYRKGLCAIFAKRPHAAA